MGETLASACWCEAGPGELPVGPAGEEKLDAMLTSKREPAAMTVSSGESWLARMSQEELSSLFA
jgi:hypothetical protein